MIQIMKDVRKISFCDEKKRKVGLHLNSDITVVMNIKERQDKFRAPRVRFRSTGLRRI